MIMDYVEFDRELPFNLTTMVVAFGGWIDAGEAATGALRHLVRHLSAPRLASMDPEEFFGVHRGQSRRREVSDQVSECPGCGLAGIDPSPKRHHHRRQVERQLAVKFYIVHDHPSCSIERRSSTCSLPARCVEHPLRP